MRVDIPCAHELLREQSPTLPRRLWTPPRRFSFCRNDHLERADDLLMQLDAAGCYSERLGTRSLPQDTDIAG